MLSDALFCLTRWVSCLLWCCRKLCSLFLVSHYTRPVQQLSAPHEEISPNHCLIPGEAVEKRFKELDKSFNQMTEQLDEAFAMQRRFSASAAHGLRAPIAVLRTGWMFKKRRRERHEYDELVTTMETAHRPPILNTDLLEFAETSKARRLRTFLLIIN